MKKSLIMIITTLLMCFVCACGAENEDSLKNYAQNQVMETPEPTPIKTEEDKFLELFEICYSQYKAGGKTADLDYAKLEDIYQANKSNETMRNLYYFCNSCGYFRLADILDKKDYIEEGKKEAAKIDPNYRGPYYEEVITFAKELLGDSYEGLSETALKEQNNFDNLTMQDKKDILNTITNSTGKDMDVLWQEIASKYGISEQHVSLINIDYDVIEAIAKDKKAQEEANLVYDATLEYDGKTVVIANTKKDLDKFLIYLSKGDNDSIQKMQENFLIAFVEKGTKVEVIEKKVGVTNIKILNGIYKGVNCWTIREAVHDKQ